MQATQSKISSARSLKAAKGRQTDIVDIMLQIMNDDDGPAPKKNFRNTTKRRNAADQFNADHYVEHAHGEKSGINSVHQHNNAVPRLIDELDKRKSVTTVTTIKARAMRKDFNPNCTACARIATLNQLKKLNLKPRCKADVNRNRSCIKKHRELRPRRRRSRQRRSSHYNRRLRDKNSNDKRAQDKLHGVHKPRSRAIRKRDGSICKLSRIWSHKSCQCSKSTINDPKESKLVCCPSTHMSSAKTSTHEVEQNECPEAVATNDKNTFKKSNNSKKSEGKFPHSRTPSLSSYNSFMSMDHEPMET